LQHPEHVGNDLISRVAHVGFADQTLAVVRDAIATGIEHVADADWLSQVAAEVPEAYSSLVHQLGVAPIPARDDLIEGYCVGVVTSLIDRDLLRQKKDLLGALQRMDGAIEPEKYGQLQLDLVRIETDRRLLRQND